MEKIPSYSPYDFTDFKGTMFIGFHDNIKTRLGTDELRKLNDSSLTLVGLGSVGFLIMQSLVQMGIGKIKAVDPEEVGQKDIELDIYSREELGKLRCNVLKDRFSQVKTKTEFEWFSSNVWDAASIVSIEDSELVVLSSDQDSSLLYDYINEECLKQNKKWLSVRFSGANAEIGPTVVPFQTACYKCYEMRLLSNQEAKVTTKELKEIETDLSNFEVYDPISIKILGNYVSLEVTRLLTGIEESVTIGKVLDLNFREYKNTIRWILRVPNCPVCGSG